MSKPHKILITGPESTGKSQLTRSLGKHYDVPIVPEYARQYLDQINKDYKRKDLDEILTGQINLEEQALIEAEKNYKPFIFCDTGPEVLCIWSEFKYGKVSNLISRTVVTRHYDVALLCNIDLPWKDDPQRETPSINDRKFLMSQYRSLLSKLKIPFDVITGTESDRLNRAIDAVEKRV